MTWSIRRDSDEPNDFQALYDGDPNMFSIKIHHGGMFKNFPGRRTYVNGKQTYVDNVDIDCFSVVEIKCIMEELGYEKNRLMSYYFQKPKCELDVGLKALSSDQDIHFLSSFIKDEKVINVYVVHDQSPISSHFTKKTARRLAMDNANNEGDSEADESDSKDEESDSEDEESDSEDEDYIVEDDNVVEDVEVDMRDYRLNIDAQVEYLGLNDQVTADNTEPDDVTVIDNEAFDSDSDSGGIPIERVRNRKLRQLQKEHLMLDGSVEHAPFYVGQSFASSTEVKEILRKYSVDSRRCIKIIYNDKRRVRAICEGIMPIFSECSEVGGSSQLNGPEVGGCSKGSQPEVVVGSQAESHAGPQVGLEVVQPEVVVGPYKKSKGIMGNTPTRATRGESCDGAQHRKKTKSSKVKGTPILQKGKKTKGKASSKAKTLKCPWLFHASKVGDSETWMVKTFKDKHRCLQSRKIRHFTSNYMSKQIVDQIKGNPAIPTKALQQELERKYEISLSWMKAFRAKQKASIDIRGDYKQQYSLLRDYCEELMKTNPGTTVTIDVDHVNNATATTRQFKRIYVCLGALKQGFKACLRELVGLNGAFMKGPYPGQMLTAVTVDPNNGIYPVAYAIVEAENIDSWTWFLECLGPDLDLDRNSNFTFITDRQKGLIQAIATVFPSAEHRYCVKHLHENMKLQWSGKAYKNLLWRCATSTTVQKFQHHMNEMKKLNEGAFKWLSKIPPQHWTRSHFTGRAVSDMLLNNLCEVLNRQLVDGRDKPIVAALDFTREYLMKRIVTVQKLIEKSEGPLTPAATKLMDMIKRDAASYTVLWNGGEKYQVSRPWGDQVVVDVNLLVCTCRKWELTGLPCKHAVATNWDMVKNGLMVGIPETWAHRAYWLETWKHAYSFKVGPITGTTTWPKSTCPTTITAPKHHTPPGRPKKKRNRGLFEKDNLVSGGKLSRCNSSVKCSKCGNRGHNSRTCMGQGGSSQAEGSRSRKNVSSQASGSRSRQNVSSQAGGNMSRQNTSRKEGWKYKSLPKRQKSAKKA